MTRCSRPSRSVAVTEALIGTTIPVPTSTRQPVSQEDARGGHVPPLVVPRHACLRTIGLAADDQAMLPPAHQCSRDGRADPRGPRRRRGGANRHRESPTYHAAQQVVPKLAAQLADRLRSDLTLLTPVAVAETPERLHEARARGR